VAQTKEAEKKRNVVLRFFDKLAGGARFVRDSLLWGRKTDFDLATGKLEKFTGDKKEEPK